MAFVHLHQHTEHSAFDGLSRIADVPKKAVELGMTAIAITDHHDLTAALKFQNACKEAGIKPIIGMEAYIAIGSRFGRNSRVVLSDEDSGMGDSDDEVEGDGTKRKNYEHLTILARNQQGWKNLLAMHNISTHPDSYWYKPRIDYELLAEKGDGLIVLTGCLAGPVAGPLSQAALWDERVLSPEGVAEAQATLDQLSAEFAVAAEAADADQVKELGSRIGVLETAIAAPQRAAESRAEAEANLVMLIDAVGKENVYLEIMLHGIQAERNVLAPIAALSEKYDVPMVVTNDSHYLECDHAEAHDTFLTAGKKDVRLDTPGRFAFNGEGYWIKSEEEMRAINSGPRWQAACDMTQVIADRVEENVIPDYGMMLPQFPLPEGFETAGEYLGHLARTEGSEVLGYDSYDEWPQTHKDRLQTELDVIIPMGVADYFLIVRDFINWCRSDLPVRFDDPNEPRKKPITMGLGRGSAAGAFTSYCTRIVGVDPIENNLLFERFLEPGRTGMPDIDIDGEDVRRPEALAYLQYRWGADRVAQIGSWGVARSKSAIKDAARALQPSGAARPEGWADMPWPEKQNFIEEENQRRQDLIVLGAKLANSMPMKGVAAYPFKDILNRSNPMNNDFWAVVEEGGETAQKIVDLAVGMENVAKSKSIHPCGVVISPVPLAEIVPLRRPTYKASEANNLDALWVICWDGEDVDSYGLLKMDVLGLLNLGLAALALDYIAETTGERMEFDKLPHPDTKGDDKVDAAWALMSSGKTSGIFQMQSAGMMRVAQDVAPNCLNDISAVVALFRPGPLSAGVPDMYAARKHGREVVDYDQYTLDPVEQQWIATVLGDTYATFVYQEQLMRLGTVIAGFDAKQRSVLRKAVGKKKADEMAKVGQMLQAGAGQEFYNDQGELISPVFTQETAARVFELMKGSAEYLFNAAHSAAYGYLAYITAYLKANWPVEYSAAVLAVAKPDMRLATLRSLHEEGVTVLAPDVNLSRGDTAPVDGKVVIGLKEIRDVGEMGHHIATERKYGPFETMADIVGRVMAPQKGADATTRKVSSSAMVGLIEAGALDNMSGTRLGNLLASRAAASNPVIPAYDWSPLEQGRRQRHRIGTIVGDHPVSKLSGILREWRTPAGVNSWGDKTPGGLKPTPTHKISDVNKEDFLTVGLISRWDEGTYSGGTKHRVNFTIEGTHASYDGVIWEKDLNRFKKQGTIPELGELAAISGRVNIRTIVLGGGAEDSSDDELEDVVLETIEVKELTANELWLVDSGPRVLKTEQEAPTFGFRARWEGSRPDPDAPKPARKTAKKTKAEPVETETVVVEPATAAVPALEPAAEHSPADDAPTPVLTPQPAEAEMPAPVDLTQYRDRRGNHIAVWLEDDFPDEVCGDLLIGDAVILARAGAPLIPMNKDFPVVQGSIVRFKRPRLEPVVGISTATVEEAMVIAEKMTAIPSNDPGWIPIPHKDASIEWHIFDWARHSLSALPGDSADKPETA